MDYEKKYKEAAKAVESLLFDAQIRHSKSVSANALADIFLELKESEDERIRKSINRLIRYYHDVNFPTPEGLSRKDLLDWINKQSEQEPNKILDSSKLKPDPNPYWTMSPEYQLANEQKPTKWNEEDERKLDNAIIQLQAASNIIFEDEVNESIAFIKSLKDRVQPKQEWSEEDEMQLDAAIHLVSSTGHIETTNWLKALKDRYTWKPSKEQMEVLLSIVIKGGHNQMILESLYQDLKKLSSKLVKE